MQQRPRDPGEIRAALVAFKTTNVRRDELVRLAREAGISIREISQLSGLSRNTIYKILDIGPASGEGSADPRDRIMKRLAGMPEEGSQR